ncbi:MAG: hypothetical protein HY257_10280 [Chloroflexi bacterium]|nr:hypothetical protein [Chloroflexota bacterium]
MMLYSEPIDFGDSVFDPKIMELNAAKRALINHDVDLKGARYDKQTRWPDGFQVPPEAVFQE